MLKIGIDFGGVLSIHDGGLSEHRETTINMPGAVEAIKRLHSAGHKLFIISFCGRSRAVETRASLAKAGLSEFFEDQFFCKDKSNKALICKYLGCDVMIDDRTEILEKVRAINPLINAVLFGEEPTRDWTATLNAIENMSPTSICPDAALKRTVDKFLYA